MAYAQNPQFPAEKVAQMFAAHGTYASLKEELFASIRKTTTGRLNTLEIASASKWVAFVQENPDWVTNKYKLADFLLKLDAEELLVLIEALETKDQAVSKALRDIMVSDIRFYWTTAEDFYIDAALDDSIIKEKYKDLPSISPKRKSETVIQNAFDKLEAKRNKKKGGDSATPTT